MLNDLERLSFIEELAEEYKIRNGAPPFSLSHWDPSAQTVNLLLRSLRLPANPLAMPYIYTHDNSKPKILELLGFMQADRRCAYVQAGTNAILLTASWLKSLKVKQILVVCPAYFSTFYAFEILDLTVKRLFMYRDKGNWRLPEAEIAAAVDQEPSQTAVWITNPVYCTGNYQFDSNIKFLEQLLQTGVLVVADECLCINSREIGGKLAWSDRFVGIYSPHKSVSVNAVKFAAIVSDKKYESFFDYWADALVGGLTASNYSAISHFLGDNFAEFRQAFIKHTNEVRNKVSEIIFPVSDLIETDDNAEGQYITCYAVKISGIKGLDRQFLRRLMLETGTIIIPGALNHFPQDAGFCFRINLARAEPQFFSSLQRTIDYLALLSLES